MSKRQNAEVEKLLSKAVAEKLERALARQNTEQLRRMMEKLFTFKNIFNIHDEHLIELGEFMLDLSEESDRLEYIRRVEPYIWRRINTYHKRKDSIKKELQWADASKNPNELEMLDLSYQVWVYEDGYKNSEYQVLNMMLDIMRSVKKCEEATS